MSTPDHPTSFTNTSTGAVEYLWDFGDGATSTSKDPTHTFEENGSYLVELTVIGPCGMSTSTAKTIQQNCQPLLIIEEDPTPSGTYQAFNSVSSDKSLEAGSTVFFKARDLVELKTGFVVNNGDQFEVDMVICTNN